MIPISIISTLSNCNVSMVFISVGHDFCARNIVTWTIIYLKEELYTMIDLESPTKDKSGCTGIEFDANNLLWENLFG